MEKQRGRPRKDSGGNMMTEEALSQSLVVEDEKPGKTTFEEETAGMDVGEFKLKKGYGRHRINGHKLCKIKGRNGQDIVFPGDVLLCPPYVIKAFRDKFDRLDAPEDAKEAVEMREVPKDPPTMHQKGKGKYDVKYDGIKINDHYLTKKEAQDLIQTYVK